MPEGSFKSSLRPTGVNTRVVVIGKAEDGSVVLFSAQSSTEDGKGGLSVQEVERAIDGIRSFARASVVANGVTIEVVPDASVFGPAGEGQEFAGGYYPDTNRIVLVASALRSPASARKTLAHELFGHFGLNLLPPAVKWQVLEGIARTRNGKVFADLWSDINRNYPDRPLLEQAEEVFARLSEDTPSKLRQWWDRFLANIVLPALRKAGLVSGRYTRTEMRTLAATIAKGIREGAKQRTFAEGFRGQRVHIEGAPSEAEIAEAKRQHRDVERAYAGVLRAHDEDGKPLPAPNGKPSNLNREQWIQVRTPNFKRWFGDWEGSHARLMPVRLELHGWKGSASDLSALAREVYADELQGTTVENASLGAQVAFSAEGKGEAFGARGKMRNPVRAELVRVLPDVILAAVKVADSSPKGKHAEDTRLFHTLVAALDVAGETLAVKVTVREALRVPASDPAHKFYDVTTVQIERSPGVHGVDVAEAASRPAPSEASSITVADLAQAFKIDVHAPDSSKVTDTNGEPLVVYHGTTETFAAFDPKKTGLRTGNKYGKGAMFFTSNPAAASAYAALPMHEPHPRDQPNVMPVFLSLQNPIRIDGEHRSWTRVTDRISAAQKAGHDSAIVRDVLDHASAITAVEEGPVDVFVAFRPGQIKSATGNTGTFGATADIRFSLPPSEQPFYSALLRAVETAKGAPKKGTAAQWSQWLDGAQRRGDIKQSERDWLGVDTWLDGRESTTRSELADFIRANEVQVQEVVLAEMSDEEADDIGQNMGFSPVEKMDDDGEVSHYVAQDSDGNTIKRGNDDYRDREFDTEAEAQEGIREFVREAASDNSASSTAPKFGDRTLPGGENYRELLLTLPAKAAPPHGHIERMRNGLYRVDAPSLQPKVFDTRAETEAETLRLGALFEKERDGNFRSSHFDQPNILAHVRFNERKDADGNKVLFIEEIQSDLHQTGRKRGYAGRKLSEKERLRLEYLGEAVHPDHLTAAEAIELEQLRSAQQAQGVPNAPFKATSEWATLAFKRMVRYAAEHGFDSVAWTTGAQQAERYDLSKHISEVHYSGSNLKAYDHNGKTVVSETGVAPEQLPDYIGKDAADKLLAAPKKGSLRSISGIDLKVGGEGMRAFYDKILPNAVNKWAKRLGGKVGETVIRTNGDDLGDTQTVHNVSITPEMRDAALSGQPLFRMGGEEAPTASDAAHLRRVHAIIQPVLKRWGKNQPRVRVLHSPELLPEGAKYDPITKRFDPRYRRAWGFYDGTTVYLVAPNLKSRRAVLKTLAHESIGHYGIDRIVEEAYGEDAWTKIEQTFARLDREGKGGARLQAVLAEVHRRYDQAGRPPSPHTFAAESFAVMAEHGVNNVLMDRLITAIRQYLRKVMPELKLSRQELRQLVVRSERYLEGEGRTAAYRARVARVQALAFDLAPQADSQAFKRWFGKSRVVNAKGEPMVLYHGTSEGFWAFDDARLGASTGHMTTPLGHFFAESRPKAARYAEQASAGVPADERVIDVYASIEHPKVMTLAEFQDIDSFDAAKALKARLEAQGFDGIHLKDAGQWVAFKNTQVKSASQNQGTFDASNADMRFSLGPDTARSRLDALLSMAAVPQPSALATLHGAALRSKSRQVYKKARNGGPVRMADGAMVRLSDSGWKKVKMHSADRRVLDIIPEIRRLMHKAVPLWEDEANEPNRPNVEAYRNYGVKVGAPSGDYFVRFVVRVGKDGRFHYDHDATSVEAVTPQREGPKHQPGRKPSPGEDAAGLAKNRLALWVARVKNREHGGFSLPPESEQDELAAALFGDEAPPGPSDTGNFSNPAASVDAMDELLAEPDAGAWETTKDWMAGKWEDIKPVTLGALQMRHLLELAEDIPALKGAHQYANEMQAMDADRNQLLMGDPHAADKPDDMLAQGAAPLTEKMRKYAFQNGIAGLFGKMKSEAKRLFKIMHDATIQGLDPSGEYKNLQMQDAMGRWSEWSPAKVKERIKQINEQIKGRPGDDKKPLMDERKRLKSLAARERRRKQAWPELVRRYQALSPEATTIYKNTRDWYAQHQDATEQALLKRIDTMKMPETYRRSLKDRVRLQFEAQRVEGVYFPLDRNGEYWISVVDADGAQGFVMFENAAEQAAAEKKLRKSGYAIEATGRHDGTYRAKDAPSGTFVNDVIQVMKKSGAPEAVQNEVYQMFLRSLPEMSMRKRHIHRKAIPGYSEDALRAFAKNSFHGSHQLARLRHSHMLQLMMENMEAAVNNARKGDARDEDGEPITPRQTARADSLMAEMKRRHDWILSPKDSNLANMMTGIGFMYFLGLSPASALVNLTQGAQVTLPVLGAKHGWD